MEQVMTRCYFFFVIYKLTKKKLGKNGLYEEMK
jgi:hypothetical protein